MAKTKKSGPKKSKSKLGSFWTTEDRPSKKKDLKRALERKELKRLAALANQSMKRKMTGEEPFAEQAPAKRVLLSSKQTKRRREEEKHNGPSTSDFIRQTLAVHAASSGDAWPSGPPPASKRARSSGPKPKKQMSEETKARLRALKSARKTKTDFSDGAALKGLKYLTRKGKPVTLGIAFLHMKARYNGVSLDSLLAKLTSLVNKGDVIYHPGVNQAKREPRYSLAKK